MNGSNDQLENDMNVNKSDFVKRNLEKFYANEIC